MNSHFVNITKELKLKPREIETKELTVRIRSQMNDEIKLNEFEFVLIQICQIKLHYSSQNA